MKKNLLAVILTLALSVGLTACGNTEDLVYMKDFNPGKYVKLGEYVGVEIPMDEPEVTEAQVDEYVEMVVNYFPTVTEVTDRTDVREGDTVNLDYEGKKDGVAFDGGTAQGASLTIGSGRFIPGFEDGMVGMQIGETKDINLTFPEDYPSEELAGADVVFTVTVNSITVEEPAEFNDQFVAEQGLEGITTVEEYREYAHSILLSQEEMQFAGEKMEAAIEAAQSSATFKDVPVGMVNRLHDVLANNIKSYAEMFGVSEADYVAAVYECDAENYEEVLKEQAELAVQKYIMLAAIAKEEGIEVTEEEMEAALEEEAAAYGFADVEAYKAEIDVEAYREYLIYTRAGEFLSEHSVLTGAADETDVEGAADETGAEGTEDEDSETEAQ